MAGPEPLQFTNAEVECLAKMEHGRWVVERLQRGWRYSDVRDITRKLDPDLVGLGKLPENIKDWHRSAARKWPASLRDGAFAVRRAQ